MAEKLTYAKETKPRRWRQNSTDDQKQSDPPLQVDVPENEQDADTNALNIYISDQEQYDLPEYQHPENLALHNDVLENEHECPFEQETEADTNSINVISSILKLLYPADKIKREYNFHYRFNTISSDHRGRRYRQLRKVLSAIFLGVLKSAIPLDPNSEGPSKNMEHFNLRNCLDTLATDFMEFGCSLVAVTDGDLNTKGQGKTVCYALPAAIMPTGTLTIVVSPTTSLIEDQLKSLIRWNVPTAAILQYTKHSEHARIHADIGNRFLRVLLVTPERLGMPSFAKLLTHAQKSGYEFQLVIDEAHCALEWSDFRDYTAVSLVKAQYKSPILLLTATITKEDLEKIGHQFGSSQLTIFLSPYIHRPNIEYLHIPKGNRTYHATIQASVTNWGLLGQRGIVYCATPGECESLKNGLEQIGMSVSIFHGRLPSDEKKAEYAQWKERTHDIMVATTAFGLGIDEPDIRFVIHTKLPTSMSTFLQESGRAGGDGNAAKSMVITSIGLQKRSAQHIIGDAALTDKQRLLKEMEVYVMNTATCRRSFHERSLASIKPLSLPATFCLSQAFQSLYPGATYCDICATTESYQITQIHILPHVQNLVKLTKELGKMQEIEVTPELLRDIFCRAKVGGKLVLADDMMKHLENIITWEKGKLDKENIDEIIARMIWQGVLVETITSTEKRFTSRVSTGDEELQIPGILEYTVKRINKR